MQGSEDADKKLLDLIWEDTQWTPPTRKFDRDCEPENTRRRGRAKVKELHLLLSWSLQCHFMKLKNGCPIMMSVS